MLRNCLLAAALTLCVLGLIARLAGHPDATPFAIWGGVLAAAVLLERWRYRDGGSVRGSEWHQTDEKFIDPESGRPVQVFYNPSTGERRYSDSTDELPR
jgi:hypothetical protein